MSLAAWCLNHEEELYALSPRDRYRPLAEEFLPLCRPNPRVLKTDAFNEAAGRAVVLDLCPGATVIELDPVRVADAKRHYPGAAFVQGDIRDMPFDDAMFDAVFDFSTIDHVPDYEAALDEYRRVLVPGGLALIVSWTSLDSAVLAEVPSAYGGTQYFFPAIAYRRALAARFRLLDARSLSPHRTEGWDIVAVTCLKECEA